MARNRQRRSQEFLDAALRIVTDEGFSALTMGRLSDELDVAASTAYRYFPSKGHLVAAVQRAAIGRLGESLERRLDPAVAQVVADTGASPADATVAGLVVAGRWLCAAAEAFPEEVRLLQMIMSQRASQLAPGSGEDLMGPVLTVFGRVAGLVDAAVSAQAIRPAPTLGRSIAWAAALSGVLEADDLEHYLPEVIGGGRLARRTSLDLIVGWGADPDLVERLDAAVDRVELPLA